MWSCEFIDSNEVCSLQVRLAYILSTIAIVDDNAMSNMMPNSDIWLVINNGLHNMLN